MSFFHFLRNYVSAKEGVYQTEKLKLDLRFQYEIIERQKDTIDELKEQVWAVKNESREWQREYAKECAKLAVANQKMPAAMYKRNKKSKS